MKTKEAFSPDEIKKLHELAMMAASNPGLLTRDEMKALGEAVIRLLDPVTPK